MATLAEEWVAAYHWSIWGVLKPMAMFRARDCPRDLRMASLWLPMRSLCLAQYTARAPPRPKMAPASSTAAHGSSVTEAGSQPCPKTAPWLPLSCLFQCSAQCQDACFGNAAAGGCPWSMSSQGLTDACHIRGTLAAHVLWVHQTVLWVVVLRPRSCSCLARALTAW